MGYTIKVNNTTDVAAALNKAVMDKVTRPDFIFAKKMKAAGQTMKDTCLVCNLTEDQFNSL